MPEIPRQSRNEQLAEHRPVSKDMLERSETLDKIAQMNIILLGIPGAGKTTLANNLELLNPDVNYISVGDISRNLPENSEQRQYLNTLFEQGSPVGIPEFFLELIEPYIDACISNSQGFILDGIPKKAEEVQPLLDFMERKGLSIDLVLSCETSAMSAYERISERGERRNDNDSMEVFANRTRIYLDNLPFFKDKLCDANTPLVTVDTNRLDANSSVEHLIAAIQINNRSENLTNHVDLDQQLPQLIEALQTQNIHEVAKILAPFFDNKLSGTEDYSSILEGTPETIRAYLEEKFIRIDPFLANTPFFLKRTVDNYIDTTLSSILHVSQSLLDEINASDAEINEQTIQSMINEQIATSELLHNLQESLINNINFNEIIDDEIALNKDDLSHITDQLRILAESHSINPELLTGSELMRIQPEIWGMLTSRKVLRAEDTNYRRNANGIPGSHHSLLPYNGAPRAMIANSMANYLPFIEAVSSSEYKYSSTFGFVHLIGMDKTGEAYSVEYPLMMYDRRLTSIESPALDQTLAKIDSLYSNHDLWHNLIPVYADHFILHHPDAPLSYGGRRDEYLRFGKTMRINKEEYEIGVAMAHSKTQQERFASNPSLKEEQINIVRQVIADAPNLYNELLSRNISPKEAIDITDFTVVKAMTRLYNIIPPSDEIYIEFDQAVQDLRLPPLTVDISEAGAILLQQGLIDTDNLMKTLDIEEELLHSAIKTDPMIAANAIRFVQPDRSEREPDSELIYKAMHEIGILDKVKQGQLEIPLEGMDKIRWIAMNAPQREQLKGHMEKVHGKSGAFRFGEDKILEDVRELVILQQEALNKDSAHYSYRITARKNNQRLSYSAYSLLFEDGQDSMAYGRKELYGLINSPGAAERSLGYEITREIDSIIESLVTTSYSYELDRLDSMREIATYLYSAGYKSLADSLRQLASEYSQLRLDELRYQESLGSSYTELAKHTVENQMTIN